MKQVQSAVHEAIVRLLQSVTSILPRLLAAVLILLVVWMLAAVARRVLRTSVLPLLHDATVRNLVNQASYYGIWAMGLVLALSALGFDAQTLVTGLGLTSVALGFALKDVLSNLVSGFLILAFRSFEIDDQIHIGDTEGTVENIDLRATHIRTYDGRLVLVPNAEVFTARVTNNTASPIRRGTVYVYLDVRENLARAMDVSRLAALQTPGVASEPPPYARLRELHVGDAMIEVRFWTDSRRSGYIGTTCAVRLAIVNALSAAGIQLPDVGLRKLVPGEVDQWQSVFMDAQAPVGAPQSVVRRE